MELKDPIFSFNTPGSCTFLTGSLNRLEVYLLACTHLAGPQFAAVKLNVVPLAHTAPMV
jgi:hypothetical protein